MSEEQDWKGVLFEHNEVLNVFLIPLRKWWHQQIWFVHGKTKLAQNVYKKSTETHWILLRANPSISLLRQTGTCPISFIISRVFVMTDASVHGAGTTSTNGT